jgi:hypothetical protein
VVVAWKKVIVIEILEVVAGCNKEIVTEMVAACNKEL